MSSLETARKRAKSCARIAATRSQLVEAARTLVGSDVDRLTDDEQEQAALVLAAATARIEMLDSATALLSATAEGGAESGALANRRGRRRLRPIGSPTVDCGPQQAHRRPT